MWYIPCDILPYKPLVVYVSGYTMIKCVLYTCIYPPSHLYILFIYWGLCRLKILAIHHYYTPSGILTSPLIFTGLPFRYKTPLYQELFRIFSANLNHNNILSQFTKIVNLFGPVKVIDPVVHPSCFISFKRFNFW